MVEAEGIGAPGICRHGKFPRSRGRDLSRPSAPTCHAKRATGAFIAADRSLRFPPPATAGEIKRVGVTPKAVT
jgi:hypothetical protein